MGAYLNREMIIGSELAHILPDWGLGLDVDERYGRINQLPTL